MQNPRKKTRDLRWGIFYLVFRISYLVCFLIPSMVSAPSLAHEARPAYLEIKESAPGQFGVLWHTPVLAGMRLPVVLKLPEGVRNTGEPKIQELSDSVVERRSIDAGPGGLAGRRIEFPGLELTITDVLVRLEMLDGRKWTTIVRPSQPWMEMATPQSGWGVAGTYLVQGIRHILFGFDHLLFVFALLLIISNRRALFWTITAFTLAHSMTLSLATLKVVHLPRPPVEAAIALSILLLAYEITKLQRGEMSLALRWPWVVAFCFGLLHGFGFASALTDIGLPQGDIPLALFSFNIGVELGQLAFIGVIFGIWGLLKRIKVLSYHKGEAFAFAAYGVGGLAAFWFFERLAKFLI